MVELAYRGGVHPTIQSLKPENKDGSNSPMSPWLTHGRSAWWVHINKENSTAAQLIKVRNTVRSAEFHHHLLEYGQAFSLFAQLFYEESLWVSLKNLDTFRPFLAAWGNAQQDAGEFLGSFLSWTQPLCANLHWKRRVQVGQAVNTADEGSRHTPPTQCT